MKRDDGPLIQPIYSTPRIKINKVTFGDPSIPENVAQEIQDLGAKFEQGKASKLDMINLDILLQWYRFPDKHAVIMDFISKTFPNDGAIVFLKGLEKFYSKDDKGAMMLFKLAAKKGFEHRMLYNPMGTILVHGGEIASAKAMYLKAFDIDSNFEVAAYNVGAVLSMEGFLEQAERYIFRSMYINPFYGRAYTGLAKVIINSAFGQSRFLLGKIGLIIDPSSPDLASVLSECRFKEADLMHLIRLPKYRRDGKKAELLDIWKSIAPPGTPFDILYEDREAIYGRLIQFAKEL